MRYLFTFLFSLSFSTIFAQNGITQAGARPAAMGFASATEADVWSMFNNPAGLGKLDKFSAFFTYDNKYAVSGLNTMGAGVIGNLPVGVLGISAFRFGDDLYNEQTVSIGYGNTFGIASLGIKANYLQYNIESFGNKGIVSIDFGGIASVTDQLIFGAYIRNINQAKVAELEDERAPTLLNAGLSYRPIKKFRLNIEAEKDLDYESTFRLGAEYWLFAKLAVRAGVNTKPFTNYAGLGFKIGRLQLDYALTKEPSLGYCHQASVDFKIYAAE